MIQWLLFFILAEARRSARKKFAYPWPHHDMNTCFFIVPFDSRFDDVRDVIEETARACGLTCVRGDQRQQPGSIMARIVRDIQEATIVVADITDHNANVLYELGIAHQIKGHDRVVIITQKIDGEKAYDIHHLDQLTYSQNQTGLIHLRKTLGESIKRALRSRAEGDEWVIRGRLPRTRMIVSDLTKVLESRGDTSEPLTIRVAAGLSSLAISDHEPSDPTLEATVDFVR